MKQKSNYGSVRQQGIALPIIMIILVLAALVTIYTTTTSVKEQQVTADQYRSEQAFSAAQAGVDTALERHNHFETPTPPDGCGITVPPERDITSDCTDFSGSEKGSFKVMFCDIWDDANDTLDTTKMEQFLKDKHSCLYPITADADGFHNDRRVGILSVGKPDDNSGRRTISVISTPALFTDLAGSPVSPLVAKGVADINGGLTIINRYSNLTVWSGDETTIKSNAAKTYIEDPHSPSETREEKISINPANNAILASAKGSNNADIIDNDYNLATLTDEGLFQGYFSDTLVNIKGMSEVYTNTNVLVEDRRGLIWLEVGGTSGNIGDWGDCTQNPPKQVLLVIETEGTAIFNSTVKVCGLVFVLGDVRLNGGLEVTGAVISVADLKVGGGGATVVYDPKVITDPLAGFRGSRGIEPGTWKDWGWNGN